MYFVNYSGISLLTYTPLCLVYYLCLLHAYRYLAKLGQLSPKKCFIVSLLFIGKSSTKRHDVCVHACG